MVTHMNRTTFLIDGFNLYHSLRAASEDLGGASTKWLNLPSLLESYLPVIGGCASTAQIYYFSALATHLEKSQPGVTGRHRNYIDCLASLGVESILGRFKPKQVYCGLCKRSSQHHEEKETDVAISIKLFEVLQRDDADTVALVTGDTDLAPAVRSARVLFPTKRIWFFFPYKRKNNELAQIADGHCNIKKERYTQHQLPPSVTHLSGRVVLKPRTW